MGRLDCKTPSLIAFEILSSAANDFCLITEEQAQDAVRIAGEMGLATSPLVQLVWLLCWQIQIRMHHL